MLLGGLWHGASWNFVIWGGIHGLCLMLERLTSGSRGVENEKPFHWLKAFYIFVLVSVIWVFFRSPSLEITEAVLSKLFFISRGGIEWLYTPAILFVPIIVLGGWVMRRKNLSVPILTLDKPYAIPLLAAEYFWVYLFFPTNINPFIYFQF